MAFTFDTNIAFSDNEACFFHLKERLKAVGWTVPESSDGTTYNSSGDQWTSISAVANANAWIRLRAPDGSYELTIQHDDSSSVDSHYRIKYSRGAGFTGGSPGPVQTPSASDEGVLIGGGTDAAPTHSATLDITEGDILHVMAEDEAPYRFWLVAGLENAAPDTFFCSDYATSVASDDQDPRFFWVGIQGDPLQADGITEGDPHRSWFDIGGGGEAFAEHVGLYQVGGTGNQPIESSVPHGFDARPDGDMLFGILTGRPAHDYGTNTVLKGFSSLVYWVTPNRPTGDTYNVDGPKSHVAFGDVALNWDGSTDPDNKSTSPIDYDASILQAPTGDSGGDSTPPQITNFSPAAGSDINPDDAITFDIIDPGGTLASVVISVVLPGDRPEVVHDGTSFRGRYTGSANTRSAIADGWRYTILRDTGWRDDKGNVFDVSIEWAAVDAGGNLGAVV